MSNVWYCDICEKEISKEAGMQRFYFGVGSSRRDFCSIEHTIEYIEKAKADGFKKKSKKKD